MKIIYIYGYKWYVYTETKPSFSFNKPGVYIIRVKNELTNRSKIIYVGTSSCLSMRAYRHSVYIEVTEKIPAHYSVHFLFMEILYNREKLEKSLIKKLKPCLNKTVFGVRSSAGNAYDVLDRKKSNLFN